MADVKVIRDGHGQIELNRCSFLHDGNIESQCIATEDLDNGMIVAINKVSGEVSKVAKGDPVDTKAVYGVNYTAERIYDQFNPGRKNFYVAEGEYPRVGILKAGDIFSTNAYLVNEEDIPEFETIETYGGVKLLVVDITDTADGQIAVKYQVL